MLFDENNRYSANQTNAEALYWVLRMAEKNDNPNAMDELQERGGTLPDMDDAAKVASCYDALSGISDPAAFVDAVREVVRAYEETHRRLYIPPEKFTQDTVIDEGSRVGPHYETLLKPALRRLKKVMNG